MIKTEIKGKTGNTATVINGDCLSVLDNLKLAHMIFTDPPYGHDNNSSNDLIQRREYALKEGNAAKVEERPILNDDYEQANSLYSNSLPKWHDILVPGGYVCCCCGGGGGHKGIQFARWSEQLNNLFLFDNAVVWDKGPIGLGWRYRRSYEFVLTAYKKGDKAKWYNTDGNVENIIRPGDYGIKKVIPSENQHPTEKPYKLALHFIANHTQPSETVLDPFMGSGSTGVAALLSGRNFIGIELDPHWYRHSVRRLEHAAKHNIDKKQSKNKKAKKTNELTTKSIWEYTR